jgi:hypothetical protein
MGKKINIFGTLFNNTPDNTVAFSDQIKDENLDKMQGEINRQFKSDIDNFSIKEVYAESDANVGIPAVLIRFFQNKMSFYFKNIKGEKGDDGIQGPKGDQGNSGVTGNIDDLVVVNNLNGGESTSDNIQVLAAAQGPVIAGMIEKNILALEIDEESGDIYAVFGADNSAFVNGGIDEETGNVYLDFNYQ